MKVKKVLFIALVAVFVLALAGTAFAVAPAVSDPVTGISTFTYKDLQDVSAKTEGGYAAFDATTGIPAGVGYASGVNGKGPHGGYSTTTNKCKVCHAVHRAEGAYYLLRADSQDDACDYCHIGGSAHSAKVVYDLNPAGTATSNGHTIGAQTYIPDSSVSQIAQAVTLSTTDANGATVTATINVRSYDPAKNEMFRLTRHHAQSPVGTGRSGWKKVGPYALRCMNCHQPHNATAQIWRPMAYDNTLVQDGANLADGYKLLRRFPSGDTTGAANVYGMFDVGQQIKVPETTLTAGFNFSKQASADGVYSENGINSARPRWIAQGWDIGAGTGPSEDPATVNQYTLSVWCADCHNLNIGGAIEFASQTPVIPEELGFKAHTERTHPAPFVGAHSGPGQCYSCHRDDLSVRNGTADPAGYGSGQAAAPVMPASGSCTQCHYGTQAYLYDHNEASAIATSVVGGYTRDSDFPHSGKSTDMKLLGSYTASVATNAAYVPTFSFTGVSETNLDAVCIRCHPGIGVHN
jgi:hypothetical protein